MCLLVHFSTPLQKEKLNMRTLLNVILLGALFVSALGHMQPTVKTLVLHLNREHSEEQIEAEFVQRSTPGSTAFQQHLDVSQLRSLVKSSEQSRRAVSLFLERSGACTTIELSVSEDSLICELVLSHQLVKTLERSGSTTSFAPRTSARHLFPQAIQSHLRAAIAIWSSPRKISSSPKKEKKLTEPGMTQTPQSIRTRYHVPNTLNFTVPEKYSNGVGEFEGEFFLASDMIAFDAQYSLQHKLTINVLGPNVNGGPDATEGTLDLQYLGAISNGKVPLWWLAQSSNHSEPGNIDFHLWVNKVMGMADIPAVISLSWGMGYQQYVWDMAVLEMDNDAFRKLGLVGVSLIAASGNSGPGTRSEIFNCNTFVPSWPASSSYLTAVGASYATSETTNEIAVDWSGGGFSTVFARPAWQNTAVKTYFASASNLPNSSFYNSTGRGYPDVAALGTNFMIYVQGSLSPVSGTSAAAPTFAGIIGLIAAERKAQGKSTLGFLNPAIYALGSVGYDITQGASQDSNCFPLFPLPGFPAAVGWDAVSGLGTPRYDYLRKHLL